jgi:hypothetical protein
VSPSWAEALGSGVTVYPPGPASPGHGSPQQAVAGYVAALESGDISKMCPYEDPDLQAVCQREEAPTTAVETVKNFHLGYTAVDGSQAVVGYTGSFCSVTKAVPSSAHSPSAQATTFCNSNSDPAAFLDSGESFSEMWGVLANSVLSYNPYTVAEVNGKWYIQGEGE